MGRRHKFDGKLLKALRKTTPYSQLQMSEFLGVSRETISAIENEKQGTIENISIDTIRRWHEICEQYVDAETEFSFRVFITKYFGF
jgi:transcriptional regulator with XRE-family HTH domain